MRWAHKMKQHVQAYFDEAKWLYEKYIPTVEEHVKVAALSGGYCMFTISSFLGMGDIATKEAFEWASKYPKIVRAASIICRLKDDIAGHKAVEVFNKRRNEFVVGVKMYTALICGWCKIGRVEMAKKVLNDMVGRGIEPNVATYNVLLNGICRKVSLHQEERFERTIRNAENVFDEMCERRIEPDATSFSIVLHVYSRAHKPEMSVEKLREMREKGVSPTVATYTSVVKCLCSCGRLEDAEELLEQMVRDRSLLLLVQSSKVTNLNLIGDR